MSADDDGPQDHCYDRLFLATGIWSVARPASPFEKRLYESTRSISRAENCMVPFLVAMLLVAIWGIF